MKERKQKCQRCKKLKPLTCFNEIDYFWGNFKKSSWCSVCDGRMDKERNRQNNKWMKNQEKLRREFVAGGGIIKSPIVGCTAKYIDDKLVIINRGYLASERLI